VSVSRCWEAAARPAGPTPALHPGVRFSGNEGRRGTARLLLGLGLVPGGRQCADLLAQINRREGFYATDISGMDLAQVGVPLASMAVSAGIRRSGTSACSRAALGLPSALPLAAGHAVNTAVPQGAAPRTFREQLPLTLPHPFAALSAAPGPPMGSRVTPFGTDPPTGAPAPHDRRSCSAGRWG
jgi:hypothetical protein